MLSSFPECDDVSLAPECDAFIYLDNSWTNVTSNINFTHLNPSYLDTLYYL